MDLKETLLAIHYAAGREGVRPEERLADVEKLLQDYHHRERASAPASRGDVRGSHDRGLPSGEDG